jgi:hypothetical protein
VEEHLCTPKDDFLVMLTTYLITLLSWWERIYLQGEWQLVTKYFYVFHVQNERRRTGVCRANTYIWFVVLTAVTMRNSFFWDIKIKFLPHRMHITSPLQSLATFYYVIFEVSIADTMKNSVFWIVTPWGSCKIWCFGINYHLYHQGDKIRWVRNNVRNNEQPRLCSFYRVYRKECISFNFYFQSSLWSSKIGILLI